MPLWSAIWAWEARFLEVDCLPSGRGPTLASVAASGGQEKITRAGTAAAKGAAVIRGKPTAR